MDNGHPPSGAPGSPERATYMRWFHKNRGGWRAYNLMRKFGMTEVDFVALLEEQDFRCKVCGLTEPGGQRQQWCVDHDHMTGYVRGLLCNRCNWIIGRFNDDPALLKLAMDYLLEARRAQLADGLAPVT